MTIIISYRYNVSGQRFHSFSHGQYHGLENGCWNQCGVADFHRTIHYIGKMSITRLYWMHRTHLSNSPAIISHPVWKDDILAYVSFSFFYFSSFSLLSLPLLYFRFLSFCFLRLLKKTMFLRKLRTLFLQLLTKIHTLRHSYLSDILQKPPS
jgi:hypothetical protein